MAQELQESRIDEHVVPEVTVPDPVPPLPVPMQWLRLAYGAEFLLAMQTSFVVWAQVGGQGHLDLLPWYTKLACALLLSYCVVKLTAASVTGSRTWNRESRVWLGGLLAVAAVMVAITYYYHLHESTDEMDSDENATTSVCNVIPGTLVNNA